VAPDRWILTGAVALDFRLGARFRTTKDLDIARWDSEQAATADFLAAQAVDLGDHFRFAIQKTTKRGAVLQGAAVRYHVSAELAGRPFEEVTVDVGLGDPPVADPELLRGPDLLRFAEIEPVEVPALPLERHMAEKVHAYTRSYAGGHPSTRVKDLIDLVLVSSIFQFEAGRLRSALRATFEARRAHTLPSALPSPPPGWALAYRRVAAEVGLDPDVSTGSQQASAFLDPILAGSASDDARWDPRRRSW